jgi:hypothetical protein
MLKSAYQLGSGGLMVKKEALKEKPKKRVKIPEKNVTKPVNKEKNPASQTAMKSKPKVNAISEKKPAIKKALTPKSAIKQAGKPAKKTAKTALQPENTGRKSPGKPPVPVLQDGGGNHKSGHRRPLIVFPK